MIRGFFALPLPSELLQPVLVAQASLKKLAPELRWLDESKLHLTLKFLGAVGESDLAALVQGLDQATADVSPIAVRATALDAFPSPRRARVLVLRLSDPSGKLVALAEALDVLAESVGVARETRPFKAHVTLARARPPEDVQALLDAAPIESLLGLGLGPQQATGQPPQQTTRQAVFDRARLYQSMLRRTGSAYDVLHECVLGGAGDFRGQP